MQYGNIKLTNSERVRMMQKAIGFIGGGNICRAVVNGLLKSGYAKPGQIYVADVDRAALGKLQEETGVNVSADNGQVAAKSDILILSIKPGLYAAVIQEIEQDINSQSVVVSIAAGKTLQAVQSMFLSERKIARVLPNTPALVGEGMAAIAVNGLVSKQEQDEIVGMFACCGKAELMPETLFDAVIAASSSAPAYAFIFIEAMADAAVAQGMPRAQAYVFCAQALLGSAKMVLETGKHPAELKDMVCSPGGTTITAVEMLEQTGFRTAVQQAMRAAAQKSRDMQSM